MNKQLIGVEIISSDISALKNSEKSLIESENNFKLMFEDAPLPYQSLDEDGNFIENKDEVEKSENPAFKITYHFKESKTNDKTK